MCQRKRTLPDGAIVLCCRPNRQIYWWPSRFNLFRSLWISWCRWSCGQKESLINVICKDHYVWRLTNAFFHVTTNVECKQLQKDKRSLLVFLEQTNKQINKTKTAVFEPISTLIAPKRSLTHESMWPEFDLKKKTNKTKQNKKQK